MDRLSRRTLCQIVESVTQINKYKCTMDQELAEAAAYVSGRCCMYTHQIEALFCMK